jgi:hypothetical protein
LGYYKIAFGKLEKEVKLEELSKKIIAQALTQATNKEALQKQYEEGKAIVYNAKKTDSYLFVFIAVKKKRTSRKIDWNKYNIEEEKFEDMASSQIILYGDGMVFIESNNKFPTILEKLNEIAGKVTPYAPNGKVMKKFYEEAEEINYMKLINIGRTEPNPHPEDEFTERLIKSISNTDRLSAHSKHGNIKEDKLMNGLEKYSTPVELTGKKRIDNNIQKFSINIKKKTKDEEIFYSISLKKPKEESPEIFEGLSKFVKKVIDSI